MQCVGGALYPNAALVLWLRNAPVDIGQRSILLQKTNRACQVIDEFWCLFKANHDEIRTLSLVIVGIFGLCFAFWRCVIADRILKQERYEIGANLLDIKITTIHHVWLVPLFLLKLQRTILRTTKNGS